MSPLKLDLKNENRKEEIYIKIIIKKAGTHWLLLDCTTKIMVAMKNGVGPR